MTIKELNKQHPEKYVMVSYEFGYPVYVGFDCITDHKPAATVWSYADTLSSKLAYHIATTGYKGLKFEPLNK